jgi:DNA-binding response OmpR family regulator
LDGHIAALAALGVDQFLSKPYHPTELVNRIVLELDRAHRSPPASWRFDQAGSSPEPARRLFKQPVID